MNLDGKGKRPLQTGRISVSLCTFPTVPLDHALKPCPRFLVLASKSAALPVRKTE